MEIQLKEIDYCKFQAECLASQEDISVKRQEVLKVFRRAPMSGFRKGKADDKAIVARYKNQIQESLKRALAEEAYHQTIVEKSIKPIGVPDFKEIYLQLDNFSCKFLINGRPNFDVVDLSTIEVPKPHRPVSEQDLSEKMLQDLRIKHGEKISFNDSDIVGLGDIVSVSYDVFLGNDKQDNLCSEGELLTVGSSKLPQLDQGLVGLKPGDSKEMDVLVPEQSGSDYAGKTLRFVVTLQMGVKNIPAPLDDELAKKEGKETYEELGNAIRSEAGARIENENKSALQQAVVARLIAAHDFKVPEWLSLAEAKYLSSVSKVSWDDLPDNVKEAYIDQASKNTKLSLVLDKIRDESPEAQLSDYEVLEIVKRHLDLSNGKTVEDALKEINNLGYLNMLYSRIRDEYTLDFVVKSVKIIE